ncbi:hypothetical protein HDU98_008557 [Podochytrium sp. JEL0797]|nr:hypothetical protein HDU98_008557 [Podochytrium sp. JEL0797]
MPNTISLTNVATFLGDNFTFSRSTTVSFSKNEGRFVEESPAGSAIDARGYLLLPGFVDAGIVGTAIARGVPTATVALDQALKRAVAQGTTVAVTANFDTPEHPLDARKTPLIVALDVKKDSAEDQLASFTSSASSTLRLDVDRFLDAVLTQSGTPVSHASGFVDVSETPSVWTSLQTCAKKLGSLAVSKDETSELAVGLKTALKNVSASACSKLSLCSEAKRGVIAVGAVADFMLIKLDDAWELSTVGILWPLFLGSSSSLRIHATFTHGHLAYALQNSDIAQSLAAATLSAFYVTPNLPSASVAAHAQASARFNTIPQALDAIRRGDMVIVVDNEDRENEGDFIMAAEDATPDKMAFMIRHSGGVICVPMRGDRLDALKLPMMVVNNEDSLKTAYTISVDFKHGTTTGISSGDRSKTLNALANPTSVPSDFTRPGHVFPLRGNDLGVLARVGHTEASLDLCRLAGKQPCAAISEVVLDEGGMARRDDLLEMGKRWGLCVITIDALVKYRVDNGV